MYGAYRLAGGRLSSSKTQGGGRAGQTQKQTLLPLLSAGSERRLHLQALPMLHLLRVAAQLEQSDGRPLLQDCISMHQDW